METLNAVWVSILILGGVITIIVAAVWLRSELVKQRQRELEGLVDTRGERITDLEKEIDALKVQMHEVRGEVNFLMNLKTGEIAAATAEAVLGEILPLLQGE